MPYYRHFIRSPSPERRQATMRGLLSLLPPRPGPRSRAIEQRRQEPTGSRHMVGGPNEIMVIEMFQSYQHQFLLDHLNIIEDNDDTVYRRCSYPREHKLAAIDYALHTWERLSDGRLEHISRYFAAKRLRISNTLLTRWIQKKDRILLQKRGSLRLRVSKVGRHPELEKRLNSEFETARSTRRQITHRWFLR